MTLYTKVSVIVPTYKRPFYLKKCLASLVNQSSLPDEIIVVDNFHFSPGAIIKKIIINSTVKIKYLHEKNRGAAAARNLGIKNARNDILAFIDDDCIADKNWVRTIARIHNKYQTLALVGRSLNALPKNFFSFCEHLRMSTLLSSALESGGYKNELAFLDAKNFSIRKSTLVKKNVFFDNKLKQLEDLDLANQLLINNIKIVYSPNVQVKHYGKNNIFSYFGREYKIGYSYFIYKKKWLKNRFYRLFNKIYQEQPCARKFLKQNQSPNYIDDHLSLNKKGWFFEPSLFIIISLSKTFNHLGYLHMAINQMVKKN